MSAYCRIAANLVFPDVWRGEKIIFKHLAPVIEERRKIQAEGGPKEHDLLQWLMDSAKGDEQQTELLTSRILLVTLAATHTITMVRFPDVLLIKTFIHAIYNLVSHPEYIKPLRDEIEELISTYGWEKTAVVKMRKLDSFLKETLRLHPVNASSPPLRFRINHIVGSFRYVDNQPFTFSNGATIPAGATVSVPVLAANQDDSFYKNGSEFDGFRFYRMREEEGESAKSYCVNTNDHFLTFGHGIHVW